MSQVNRVALEKFLKFSKDNLAVNCVMVAGSIGLEIVINNRKKAGKSTAFLRGCKLALNASYAYHLVKELSKA